MSLKLGRNEHAVQTFKVGMKRLTEGSVSTRVSRFLFKCRITLHSTTGVPHTELIFGIKICSHLDHLPRQDGKEESACVWYH